MKKAILSHAEKSKLLKPFGYSFTRSGKKDFSKYEKSKINKAWNTKSGYFRNEVQKFVFKKASKEVCETLKKGLSKGQFTPTGFFLRMPKGCTRSPTYRVDKAGVIHCTSYTKNGRKVLEEIHEISPKMLAEDPPKAIKRLSDRANRKGAVIKLTVNGWDSSTTVDYDLETLSWYVANSLLPKFRDPNIADEIDRAYNKTFNPKRKRKSIKEFSDLFHVVITTHERNDFAKPSKKNKNTKPVKKSKTAKNEKRKRRK